MFPQSANDERPYLQIKSYNKDSFALHNITVVEGRLPETENEIVLNIETVEDGADVQIGDVIEAEHFKRYLVKNQDSKSVTVFSGGMELSPGQRI